MSSMAFGDYWEIPGVAHAGIAGVYVPEEDFWVWVSPDENGEPAGGRPLELTASQARELAAILIKAAEDLEVRIGEELADLLDADGS